MIPDAEGIEGMSASKMRKAAVEDDFDTFDSGLTKSMSNKDREALYLTLRQSMKVSESLEVLLKHLIISMRLHLS